MNSNKELSEIIEVIKNLSDESEITGLLSDLFTETELKTLSKRWRILKMLSEGETQREISKQLKVSLCKVTRGAKILKDSKSIVTKCIMKEK